MMNLTYSLRNNRTSNMHTSAEQLQFIPGLWVEGKYFWLQTCTEKIIYEEELLIKVKQEQIHSKIRLASVYISNHSHQTKEIKMLAMHYSPNVNQEQLTFVSPSDNRIFHLVNKTVFTVNGLYQGIPMKECTTVPQWNVYADKIWSSLQKGSLRYQPMVKGLAASIFTIKMTIKPRETKKMNTWIIHGSNKNEVISLEQALLKNTLAFPYEK